MVWLIEKEIHQVVGVIHLKIGILMDKYPERCFFTVRSL
jgi:hypothetical protein